MRSAPMTCEALEGVDVECTHCGVRMTTQIGGGGHIRYFHCPSCQRWTSSVYSEVFRADTKMRTRKPQAPAAADSFGQIKERLERWLASLGASDPYGVLGCAPTDGEETLRARYRALAREHHPDVGGSASRMQAINNAYQQALAAGRSTF